jgi:hypothetical protein
MKTFLQCTLLAAAVLSLVSCREKVIVGTVTDEQGQGIADAVVRIESTQYETRTGPDGKYQLDYVPGEVKLVTLKEGYEPLELTLSIPEKQHYEAPQAQLLREDNPMKQKQTVSDMRNLGTALFSWLTDQVGAAAAGQKMNDVDVEHDYVPTSLAELEELLVPQYAPGIPEEDGWGHDYDFYLNARNPLARQVMAIRSPGRDGTFSSGPYRVEGFTPEDYDEDIVWVDGFFVRWPERGK